MKKLFLLLALVVSALVVQAKTLIVYYSYTNNVEKIVNELSNQIEADVVEIEPSEKGLDYAANNLDEYDTITLSSDDSSRIVEATVANYEKDGKVYDLKGNVVLNSSADMAPLSSRIYIVNGKKTLVENR